MAQIRGFNVGVTISLGDMELALDYLNDSDVFMPEIEDIIKNKSQQVSPVEECTSSILMSDNATAIVHEPEEDIEDTDNNDDIDIVDIDDYFEQDEEESEEQGDGYYEETSEIEDGNKQYSDDIEDETIDIEDDYFEDDVEEADNYFENNVEDSDDYFDTDDYYTDEEEVEEIHNTAIPVTSKQQVKQQTTIVTNNNVKSARELELERKLQEALNKLQQKELEEKNRKSQELEAKRIKTDVDKPHLVVDNSKQPVEKSNRAVDKSTNVIQKTNNIIRNNNQTVKPALQNKGVANNLDKITIYSAMDIDALYKEVKKFMIANGVTRSPVDRGLLEREFGAMNIRKLLLKSYLIIMGKGLTIGK